MCKETNCQEFTLIENFLVCQECGECKENLITSFIDKSFPFYTGNISTKERNIKSFKEELDGLNLNVSKNILLDTIDLYAQVYPTLTITKKGGVRLGLKAACFYYACKQNNIPREKKTIAEQFNIDFKSITKSCNYFLDTMGDNFIKMRTNIASDFLETYLEALELPIEISDKFQIRQNVLKLMKMEFFIDCSPSTIICTALYISICDFSLDLCPKLIFQKYAVTHAILKRNYSIYNAALA